MSTEPNAEVRTQLAVLQSRFDAMERTVVWREDMTKMWGQVEKELTLTNSKIDRLADLIADLAKTDSKNAGLIEDILNEKKSQALAAAEAERQRSSNSHWFNVLTKYVFPICTLIVALAAVVLLARGWVYFAAHLPKP